MIFQENLTIAEVLTPMGTMISLIFLIILMLVLYGKYRVFPLILVVFLFSLVLGVMAVEVEIPLTPYFQVFFIIFQTIIFVMTVFDLSKKRYK